MTAGTYATAGIGVPARVGLTVVKAAGKTGRIGARMGAWITRSLREIVDWGASSRAAKGSMGEPAVAVRAARDAVKANELLAQQTATGDDDPMLHADAFDVMVRISEAIPASMGSSSLIPS